MLSVVFFGTREHKNSNDFPHVYVLQVTKKYVLRKELKLKFLSSKDLDQTSAERIKELEKFWKEFDRSGFKTKYGHSNDYSLEDVLWCCSIMFSTM